MLAELHFLRPWWLLLFIPLIGIALVQRQNKSQFMGWSEICDSHLLAYLAHSQKEKKQRYSWLFLYLSFIAMISALAGPAWQKLPVPTYKTIQPRVLILDMSEPMLDRDLTPNRLSRAKFKLHDLLVRKGIGQFGLLVYTGEPFVVSPLTDDGQTIASLLSALTPDVMPVAGQKLETALEEAARLLKQAGYSQGQILVLTASQPTTDAITTAEDLAQLGIDTSIMPMRADNDLHPLFARFATAGHGKLVQYRADSSDLDEWINHSKHDEFKKNTHDEFPVWRDEGRWFLIPALLFFLPVFRKGWLQRMVS